MPLSRLYGDALDREVWFLIAKKPKYVWGGIDETKGLDCSGFIYCAAKRAGLPVRRVTAKDMRYGLGGWLGTDSELRKAEQLYLTFWTWGENPKREHGHVGIVVLGPRSRLYEVAHASQSRGSLVVQQCKGKLDTDISAVRKLTIGD